MDAQERVLQVGGTASARSAERTQVTRPQVMAGPLGQVESLHVILSSTLGFGSGPQPSAVSTLSRHSASVPGPRFGRGGEGPAG